MSTHDDAARLEALLPQVLGVLFHSGDEDPLRHNSVGQIRLMRTLMAGSRTASDLSHQLGLSPSSLTQMASRMITAGLVSKELDTEDRRVRKLSLTPAGRHMMEGRKTTRAVTAAKLLDAMDKQKIALFIEILEEIASFPAKPGRANLEAAV